MSRNARELIIQSFNGTLHSAAEYWQAIKRTSVCLIQIDAELHLCAVMAEKNAIHLQTSYVQLPQLERCNWTATKLPSNMIVDPNKHSGT